MSEKVENYCRNCDKPLPIGQYLCNGICKESYYPEKSGKRTVVDLQKGCEKISRRVRNRQLSLPEEQMSVEEIFAT